MELVLDAGPGDGFPWWAFLMMPFMMLGMWLMMRLMMGMGGHGAAHGPGDTSQKPAGHPEDEAEVASLRREVDELRSRLAAVEGEPTAPATDQPEPQGNGADEHG